MQDKDFDRFIQQSLDSFPEPEYDPAHWDKLEDRLHNLNASQPQPSAGSGVAGTSFAKLGFVASAILVTALNVAVFTKPDLFKNATGSAPETETAIARETAALPVVREAETGLPAEGNSNNNNPETGFENAEAPAVAALVPAEAETAAENTKEAAATITEKGNARVYNQGTALQAPENKTAKTNKTKNKTAAAGSSNGIANQSATSLAWPGAAANRPGSTTGGMTAGKPQAIATENCAGNAKPTVSLALAGNDTVRDGRLKVMACQTLTARFFTADKDADKITVTSNIASILPGATLFSDKADQPGLMLRWDAKPEMARQQPYEFTLWLTDNRCPNAEPQAIKYALNIVPAFNLQVKGNTNVERGETTTLEVTGAPVGATYRWSAAGATISGKERVQLQPTRTTTYHYQVNSPAGCVLTDSVKVIVTGAEIAGEARKAEIPNIFTPNNDGINDFFEVKLPEAGPYHLEIFDRDGRKIFEDNNYKNKWNAAGVAPGVYYYIVSARAAKKVYKGWVEVIR